ncbi:uncharacterized protein LOC103354902 [Stegastes partitus]|uniref:Uncharacterized protein LOC103354902 n=1 Tax=Stegastes partitus TaxID=144197 RepID=A0A9Y4MX06_9TELE|nr:PREDICTED: uncharacterized protein LOC103354902 [Stegastes partitus]
MGFTGLHVLCLLSALTLTTQDLVDLTVSPSVTAECDQQVTLNCDVSPHQHGLSITHMEWVHDKTQLCTVNSSGELNPQNKHSLGDFKCEYDEGRRLTLTFPHVGPLNKGTYRCKLRSNRGAPYKYTAVELQECRGKVDADFTSRGPSCTFHRVHPDGEVHWFHGSHNLSDGFLPIQTSKSVDEQGYLTIRSELTSTSSNVPHNCSLKSIRSGRYIESTLVKNELLARSYPVASPPSTSNNGVRSQEPIRTILCVLIFLAAIMK